MVRLFVGGLDKDVTPELLSSRFISFGKVESCEVVPAKDQKGGAGSGAVTAGGGCPCRGFAYVELTPKNDSALHRCVSLYNGCRWRGGVLRVEKARLDFRARLQVDWESQEEADRDAAQAANRDDGTAAAAVPPLSSRPVRVMRPDRKRTVAAPAEPGPGSRSIFPPYKLISPTVVSWSSESLKLSEGAVRKAAVAGQVEPDAVSAGEDSDGESDTYTS